LHVLIIVKTSKRHYEVFKETFTFPEFRKHENDGSTLAGLGEGLLILYDDF
jgi:hypothetical protein